MTNHLNEKSRGVSIVAVAIITALLAAIASLVTGLVLEINKHVEQKQESEIARMLLVDAAEGLSHSLSAMRLCNEPEPAAEISKTALVYAVRAETALECDNADFDGCRCKEAFLNDITTILNSHDPLQAVELSQLMYEYSVKFCEHVRDGSHFEYNGELIGHEVGPETEPVEHTPEQIEAARLMIQSVLGAQRIDHIGGLNMRIEFDIERNGEQGYAVVDGTRICEFSFAHSGSADGEPLDEERAGSAALDIAADCGYPDLAVINVGVKNDYALVLMCKVIDGALCCDEYASAVVTAGDNAVSAFHAGKVDCEHVVPAVKKTERQARLAAPSAVGEGILVTRTYNGRDRVCYRYAVELEDGVHYIYVCAENGRQMQVM